MSRHRVELVSRRRAELVSRSQVELEGVHCKRETVAAILCDIDGQAIWIPKSQVRDASEVQGEGDEGTLVVSEWIALEKGIL